MKLYTFNSGFFLCDGGSMFGLLPKKVWAKHYSCDENNYCQLAMRCGLIITDERKILIDTGIGPIPSNLLKGYQFSSVKTHDEMLSEYSVSKQQITDVILSHLHFDHCTGSVERNSQGSLIPAFPNATYHISRRQLQQAHNPQLFDSDSFLTNFLSPLSQANQVNLIDHDTELCRGVRLRLFNGHTPGQIVTYATTDKGEFVFAGDVVPLALNIMTESISAFDLQPADSMTEKLRLLEEAAIQNQTIIFYHDAYTVSCKVKRVGSFYKSIFESTPKSI